MLTLPGITIQDKIYESSASLVYRGIREQDDCPIVVKLLKQDYPSPQELTRYRQEYEITRSLNLEGVVEAYSQQDYQRTLVIFLEDFGGESLDHWMRQRPETFYPMPLPAFLRLAINLTAILGRIHRANIIHKDINPGNIVLNPDTGVVKVIDFGIATRFSRTSPIFQSPHRLEGTLAYLSPEQTGRMNRVLDYRTDFYSLGITFYELLTGHLPFPTTDILELVHCHLAKLPIPPHELNAVIPKPISEIVLKLMAKNAEDRYQSAWGIKADLELCANQLAETGQIEAIQLGLQDHSDQFQIPQKLYGRAAEIEALLAAFDRIAGVENVGETFQSGEGRGGSSTKVEMMLVSGYAGIGKSALVQELYKPITAKRGYFISGKFDQFQRNIPYSAIARALQKLVQQLLSEPEEQLQQWKVRILTALGTNGQIISNVIPEIELIIGQQHPVPEVGATEAQNRFNRVFQQFIRVFCSKEHPLVIFLDDLQWVDSATLKLIELMMTDAETQYLFLIGAYRDNEVSSLHPLTMTLEELKKERAIINQITLAPLGLNAIAQLIADTLHSDITTVNPLAELVLRKTGGNPFFANEFLKTLHTDSLLSFDLEHLCWQWNITYIEGKNITDNVVELMLGKLKKLPVATQQVLQLAACVGADFDLSTLSIICGSSPNKIFSDLVTAVQSGLVVPISELDQQLLVQDYKFLHDRVQQAAHALIDESQKQVVHLQIGRNLLEKTLPEQRSERLFEIVDHLNHGIELVTDPTERNEIAQLNLAAGQKAKVAIAYGVAKKYLATGRAWLTASGWQTNYDLTLELYSETTEVAFFCGDFADVEAWMAIVLQEAKTVLDSVKVYEVKIQTYIAQEQLLEAINTGLQVLPQLGVSFPETHSQSDIQLELDTITSLLKEKRSEDLVHTPKIAELDKLAAMRILSSIMIAAHLAAPDVLPLFASKQVSLSIQYSNALVPPFAYALYGFILCRTVGDIDSGYEFGQLALRQLSRPDTQALKAKTLLSVNIFIVHWKKHFRETLQPFLEGYQSGLETGDSEFAAYCAEVYCLQCVLVGKELVELERKIRMYSQIIHQLKQQAALTWTQMHHQVVLNLMGRSDNPLCLVGEAYNEGNRLRQNETEDNGTSIFFIHFYQLFLCYLFCEYSQAVENSIITAEYVHYVASSPPVPVYYFYSSLARLATYPRSNPQAREEILKEVAVNQEKMQHWAHYAPMNHLHKYHLVEAEKARVLGQWFEAEEFYEQAIQGAKDNDYLQEEALAYELAAKFYLARGREKFAQTYMKEAHYCYERWGASAKVKDLETRYPPFFPQSSDVTPSVRKTTGTTSNHSDSAFDLATVMKASQAISSEIELDQLLRALMKILIENAGAQAGFLILESSGEWVIEASGQLSDDENIDVTQVLQSISLESHLPESIVQYVIRTHELVILEDATREGNFINEPYIQNRQTQSVLCLPLLNQGKLVGILYLENQLAAGAFTPDRAQVLNLLSTQAAIAIENAKLYSKLRASESQMAQFLEAVPVGIGVVDTLGRPCYANQQAIELLGKGIVPAATSDQLAEVYQLHLAGTNQPYPIENLPVMRALSGERTRIDDLEIRQRNTTIPVEGWGTPIFDEQGNIVYAISAFQDISERKRAERLIADYNQTLEQQVAERTLELEREQAALQQSEATNRAIISAIPDLLIQMGQDGTYLKVVRSGNFQLFNPQQLKAGVNVYDVLPPNIAQMRMEYAQQAIQTGELQVYEQRIVNEDQVYNQEVRIAASGNDEVLVMVRDISEQKNAALRERKQAEEASILEERNRMAREIHDTLAQSFTSIIVHLDAASQRIEIDPVDAQSHLKTGRILARSGLADARRSVEALRPQILEEGDLRSALDRFAAQIFSHTPVQIVCEAIGEPQTLSIEVEANLLRIGQEALTNAFKYANGNKVSVELRYEESQCVLQIKDNGQGFESSSLTVGRGFGLLGMTERAERIGAELTIESHLGQGTEIIVRVQTP